MKQLILHILSKPAKSWLAIGALAGTGTKAGADPGSKAGDEIDPVAGIAGHMPTCPSQIPFEHFKIHLKGMSILQPTNASRVSLLIHIAAGKSGSGHPSTK